MCTVCGCGDGETRVKGHTHDHHHHGNGHDHAHSHDHGHHHDHHHDDGHHRHGDDHHHHYGQGMAGVHVPGLSQSRIVEIEQNILSKNDAFAAENRARFEGGSVLALNLVSSPGAGKTTLLVETLRQIMEQVSAAVIEGDQETSNDADRIRATGAPAIQVNTGKGCHLDAHMVGHAADHLELSSGSVLFIENVGNLVCPAGFDLGEAARIVLLSVTEGDDKPLKYPDIFAGSDLVLITKSDLAPHVDFSIETCLEHARKIKPDLEAITLSAKTGEGMAEWIDWIAAHRHSLLQGHVDRLEAELARARAQLGA